MLRIVFDVPRLKAKRKELEQISAQPEFWENQEAAKKQMLILDDVKAQLELLDKWKTFISDAKASLELYSLEPEEEMILESQKGLKKLKENLDSLNKLKFTVSEMKTINIAAKEGNINIWKQSSSY